MNHAYILCELDRSVTEGGADNKSARLLELLNKLEYKTEILSKELCDPKRVELFETQGDARNGWRADYAEKTFEYLKKTAAPGNLILLTQPWHHGCLRGLERTGKFHGSAVVEAWIDYPHASARYRIYPSWFHLNLALGMDMTGPFRPEWLAAYPFYSSGSVKSMSVHEPALSSIWSLNFMEEMSKGVPIVAPEWGSWFELVQHGVAGALYRSPEGRRKALDIAAAIPTATVQAYVAEMFYFDKALRRLEPFLKRTVHG